MTVCLTIFIPDILYMIAGMNTLLSPAATLTILSVVMAAMS
jgi:hypothetical protein